MPKRPTVTKSMQRLFRRRYRIGENRGRRSHFDRLRDLRAGFNGGSRDGAR